MSTESTVQSAVRYDRDADGIVTLTLDDPTASANTMNDLYRDAMVAAVNRLYADLEDEATGVTGVVIAAPTYWLFTKFLAVNLPGLTGTGWI